MTHWCGKFLWIEFFGKNISLIFVRGLHLFTALLMYIIIINLTNVFIIYYFLTISNSN